MTGQFTPLTDTITIATPGATGGANATPLGVSSTDKGSKTVRAVNNTNGTIFIKFGTSSVSADKTKDMPMLSGTTEVFEIGNGVTHVDAITASGTATGNMYFTLGRGV